jgi:hypothetical protein
MIKVPISYSGADVISKIIWLKSHPKKAEMLAQNARNFGELCSRNLMMIDA